MPEVSKNFFTVALSSRISAMITFGVHFVLCLIVLIIGGLIADGAPTRGTFAAADAFRYIGYLFSIFLAIIFFIVLIVLRGGLCFTIFWFVEFPCFLFQLLAWIFDAVNASKLSGSNTDSFGLAVAAAIIGVLVSLFTLYIAISLIFTHGPLAETCGGRKDCCGVQNEIREANAKADNGHKSKNKSSNKGKEDEAV